MVCKEELSDWIYMQLNACRFKEETCIVVCKELSYSPYIVQITDFFNLSVNTARKYLKLSQNFNLV